MTKLFYCILMVSQRKKIEVLTDALIFWREKTGRFVRHEKETGGALWRKKNNCIALHWALRGIQWNVLAFLVFTCVELDSSSTYGIQRYLKHSPTQEIPKPETQLKQKLTIIRIQNITISPPQSNTPPPKSQMQNSV